MKADRNIMVGNLDTSTFDIGTVGAGGAIALTATNGSINAGNLNTYSLGLGYNLGGMKIDISYFRSNQDARQSLYQTSFNNAYNERTLSNIAATFSVNL